MHPHTCSHGGTGEAKTAPRLSFSDKEVLEKVSSTMTLVLGVPHCLQLSGHAGRTQHLPPDPTLLLMLPIIVDHAQSPPKCVTLLLSDLKFSFASGELQHNWALTKINCPGTSSWFSRYSFKIMRRNISLSPLLQAAL